jgi:hypothetical protein
MKDFLIDKMALEHKSKEKSTYGEVVKEQPVTEDEKKGKTYNTLVPKKPQLDLAINTKSKFVKNDAL